MNDLSTPVSYLPLQKFHIIKIEDLDPKSIKTSARKAKCDREKIKYNTLLNATSKALGFKGGFAEYQHIYESKLVPFLNQHGMKTRVNLLTQRKKGFDTFLPDITHQQLSERLFCSGLELPEKIFTGYNFDYIHTIDDGSDYFNRVLCTKTQKRIIDVDIDDELKVILGDDAKNYSYEKIETVGPHNLKKIALYDVGREDLEKVVEHNINIANKNSSAIHDCPFDKRPLKNFFEGVEGYVPETTPEQAGVDRYKRFANRTILDLVVGSFIQDLECSFNLLGDTLVQPAKRPHEVEFYLGHGDEASLRQSKKFAMKKLDLFRKRIEQDSNGWIDIIPFNHNLIFLRGESGQYDFVFKNQRDSEFDHQVFGKSLKRADIPSFIQDYRFLRWYYFEYQGWRSLDSHNSENLFYERGNSSSDYPGRNTILQSYYEAKGDFIPEPKTNSIKLSGFHDVIVGCKPLMISNLITIDELNSFKENNNDYLGYRKGDNLESVNNENDNTLPATVTWFDVLAYINWFEKETSVPVRLLNLSEYTTLREPENIKTDRNFAATDLEFIDNLGNVLPEHPPYMPEDHFQELICRFGNIEKSQTSFGLNFMKSNFFAEWLLEETCIRSGNLKSFYGDEYIVRSKPPLKSTGKYKGVKVGFRLCYELTSH
jgi:hypothetical protein